MAEVPAGVVTVTSTVPLVVAAGLGTVSWVSLATVRFVVVTVPKLTSVALVKPLPVTVTVSPPAIRPLAGLTPVQHVRQLTDRPVRQRLLRRVGHRHRHRAG